MATTRPAQRPTPSLRSRLRSVADRLTDALSPGAVRTFFKTVERKAGFTRAGQLVIVAAVGALVVARVIAGNAMYIFAYGAFVLIVASFLLIPRRSRLEGSREGLFPRAQEGDRLEVHVRLKARRGLGAFILEESIPERLGRSVQVAIPRLARGREVTHHYSIRCARRGVYEIGPLLAVTSDPLGLTQREKVVCERYELLVHPRIEVVSDRPLTRRFEDPPIRPPVSKPWPSGLEFYGMRDYKPGDDLRRIVWRASARTGRLMVREAEEGITDHVTIVVDTDRGSHSHEGDHCESFETGVRAAASLAVRHLREGYSVRVEANAGPLTRPVRGLQAQLGMLDAFARVDLDREPLTKAIARLIQDPRRDAHNIFVTPKLGEHEAAQLRILLQKGVSVLVVALLWDEENAATAGIAASQGCQVAAVRPGQDLTSALHHDTGAGSR